MQYLVLLHDEPTAAAEPGTPEWDADVRAFDRFGELAGDAIVAGEALAPGGYVIRHGEDGPVVTEGPFTEAAEVLGGLFVLEADDLDHVLELAAAIPTAATGALEVRPVVDAIWQPDIRAPEDALRYLALLHGAPTAEDRPDTDAWKAAVAEQGVFGQAYSEVLLGGAALHPPETATTLRVRDDQPLVTDGPFTETAEVAGGYYLLCARSQEEAIATAAAIPVGDGAVELRPIVELDG